MRRRPKRCTCKCATIKLADGKTYALHPGIEGTVRKWKKGELEGCDNDNPPYHCIECGGLVKLTDESLTGRKRR